MNAFYFIFSRFKKLKSKKGFLAFNFYLSIFLITFSLVAIILTDSFTQGYKNEIFSKLESLNPDFKIIKYKKNSLLNEYDFYIDSLDLVSINNDLTLIKEKIYTPYIEKMAIVFSERQISPSSKESYKQREGIYVLGIEKSFLFNNSLINKYFDNKNFNFSDNSIIIGNYLSKKINKTINDEIDLLFFDNSSKSFIAKRFIIQNIYNTQTQNDEFLSYVPIAALKDDNLHYSGIIGDFLDKDKIIFNKKIFEQLYTTDTAHQSYHEPNNQKFAIKYWDSQNVLKFLNSFDVPVKLLMWILMFLSVYSLSSLIFNFLIEKKEDLKILYLMGYEKKRLRYIAVSISLYISIISILIGNLISLLVIFLQNNFQIINLPSEKIFQLTFIPAYFDVVYFIKYPIFLILFTAFISLYVFNKNFKIDLK